MIQRMWQAQHVPGFEHLRQIRDPWNTKRFAMHSLVMGLEDQRPFQIRYRVDLNTDWHTLRVQISDQLNDRRPALELISDGAGHWTRPGDSAPLTDLDGCIDIDISVSPFTNTLPIRRLGLEVGDYIDIDVVYLSIGHWQVSRQRQRYTRLGLDVYRFEQDDFRADLTVDAECLVIRYPGLFTRVWETS